MAEFKNGYALLIGAGKEDDLPMAITDAKALYSLLTDQNRAGYIASQTHLITEKDANSKNIIEKLDVLVEQVNKAEDPTVFIYYSGHGGFKKNDDSKKYYLFPYGYKTDDTSTLVSSDDLVSRINSLKTKKLIVLFDCCYAAGVLNDEDEPEAGFDAKGEGPDSEINNVTSPLIQKMSGGEGRVIVGSCQDDQVSWGKLPHSVFTESMLEALTGVNSSPFSNTVHVLDVLQHVFNRVPYRTRKTRQKQKPVVNEIKNLTSDFFLCQYNVGAANQMRAKGIGDQQSAMQSQEEKMDFVKTYIKTEVNITETNTNQGQSGGTSVQGSENVTVITNNFFGPSPSGSSSSGPGKGSKASSSDKGSGSTEGITIDVLRNKLAQNADRNIGKILDKLVELTDEQYPDYNNDAIMIKSAFTRWKNNQMVNTEERNNLEYRRLNHQLLSLFDSIEEDGDDIF